MDRLVGSSRLSERVRPAVEERVVSAHDRGAAARRGRQSYRAFYEPFPSSTFGFQTRHSINDEEFTNFDAEMTKAGFTRVFQQRIIVGQRAFNQGTWTKP